MLNFSAISFFLSLSSAHILTAVQNTNELLEHHPTHIKSLHIKLYAVCLFYHCTHCHITSPCSQHCLHLHTSLYLLEKK